MSKRIFTVLILFFWVAPGSGMSSLAQVSAQVGAAWLRTNHGPGDSVDDAPAITGYAPGDACLPGRSVATVTCSNSAATRHNQYPQENANRDELAGIGGAIHLIIYPQKSSPRLNPLAAEDDSCERGIDLGNTDSFVD
ncbi:MAG: hypothetical protein WCE90_03230 [Candidatus Zixiibacteriota bacterium]